MDIGIGNIAFIVLLIAAIALFTYNVAKITRNIKLGKKVDRSDNKGTRFKRMAKVALGQSKMVVRPVAGFMHVIVYLGFIIINIEVAEIVIDGIFGTHRIFEPFSGIAYDILIGSFEILAVLVILACAIFLVRRNLLKLKRFWNREMTSWPRTDANLILIFEIALMSFFLTMNAADGLLMSMPADKLAAAGLSKYAEVGMVMSDFWVTKYIAGFLPQDPETLFMIERGCWWAHIVGIFIFLNYVPYSKHFHIFLSFPNVYYSSLQPKGEFDNLESITKEVKMMTDPNADPYAAPAPEEGEEEVPEAFGAKDVTDLTRKQLMDAYSCTECGRCTSECPANITGKLLSPRKIMMDTRDRLEEVGKNVDKHGKDHDDGKTLVNDYIKSEELWACTTCNACVEACPVNINPLSIIVDLRRSLVMEDSAAPSELNTMFSNVENNAAPWQFGQADRMKWAEEE